MDRKEEMFICCQEQNFSAEYNGMIAFDLGVVIKIQKILDKENSQKSSSAQHDIKKTKKEICEGNKQRKFEFKCICDWSKDDKYGFIPNTKCPVHGKETKLKLSKTVPYKSRKISK